MKRKIWRFVCDTITIVPFGQHFTDKKQISKPFHCHTILGEMYYSLSLRLKFRRKTHLPLLLENKCILENLKKLFLKSTEYWEHDILSLFEHLDQNQVMLKG
jgi:hypothetical protein